MHRGQGVRESVATALLMTPRGCARVVACLWPGLWRSQLVVDEAEDQAWAELWQRLGAEERRRLLGLALALLHPGRACGSMTS
jgi:hypothetical protein